MDRSFKFHLISQMACSPWPSFIPSLWKSLFFPIQEPNSSLKVFISLHWWCRKPWDYTTHKDFPVECQLCCGIPLKPVVSHLWGVDLRSVGLTSRASFFLPWLSMWWELLEQDSVKVLLPACGWHACRSTAPDVHLISCQVYSCPWRHWKMKGPLPAGLICFHDGTRVRIPAIVSTSFWRKGLENLGKCLPLWICFAFLNPHKDVKRGARLGLQLSTRAIES